MLLRSSVVTECFYPKALVEDAQLLKEVSGGGRLGEALEVSNAVRPDKLFECVVHTQCLEFVTTGT